MVLLLLLWRLVVSSVRTSPTPAVIRPSTAAHRHSGHYKRTAHRRRRLAVARCLRGVRRHERRLSTGSVGLQLLNTLH